MEANVSLCSPEVTIKIIKQLEVEGACAQVGTWACAPLDFQLFNYIWRLQCRVKMVLMLIFR